MDWEYLLCSLWDLMEERGSVEFENCVRDLLKEQVGEEWLESYGHLLRSGQLDSAKSLVSDFLRNHDDLAEIVKKLETSLSFERPQSFRLSARKAQNREQLLLTVNSLVSSGKLVAAEELLDESLAEGDSPELLDLLGRVYMIQRRPQEAAGIMQRALLARRHQSAFIAPTVQAESNSVVEPDDEVSDTDLAYLTANSSTLTGLDDMASWQNDVVELGDLRLLPEPDSNTLSDKDETTLAPPSLVASHDDQQALENVRKTLSLKKPRKVEPKAKPEGVRILVKHASPPSAGQDYPTTPTYTVGSVQSTTEFPVVRATGSVVGSDVLWLQEPDDFYSEHDIHELVGATSDYQDGCRLFAEEPAESDYESDDSYLFDSETLLVEQLETGNEQTYEPVLGADGVEDEYAVFAFDPDEFYDTLNDVAEDMGLLDDSISREDRALQKAVELITKMGWSLSALPLIQQIFVMSGWGATRLALEREIEKGMTPEELILAAHVKVTWYENDYYWIAYDKNGSSNLSQYVLSWPSALLIVRSFESLPQIEELEQFIESLYEYWYERAHLRRAFRSFNRFLWFRVANLQGCLPADQFFSFGSPYELPVEEYSDLGLNDLLEIELAAKLRALGVFQTKHPQEPGVYVSDIPLPLESYAVSSSKEKSTPPETEDMISHSADSEPVASIVSSDQPSLDSRSLEKLLALCAMSSEKDATFDV